MRSRVRTDGDDLFCGKFRHTVALSKLITSFCFGVSVIIEACSGKQMIRVHAGRIIAFVADYLAGLKWRLEKFIGNAMGALCFSIQPKEAIAVFVGVAIPNPAGALEWALDDHGHEPIFQRQGLFRPGMILKCAVSAFIVVMVPAQEPRYDLLPTNLASVFHGGNIPLIHGEVNFAV